MGNSRRRGYRRTKVIVKEYEDSYLIELKGVIIVVDHIKETEFNYMLYVNDDGYKRCIGSISKILCNVQFVKESK